jgi:hypothetical protein
MVEKDEGKGKERRKVEKGKGRKEGKEGRIFMTEGRKEGRMTGFYRGFS